MSLILTKRTEVQVFFCVHFSTFSTTHDDTIRIFRCDIFTPTAGILQTFLGIQPTLCSLHEIGRILISVAILHIYLFFLKFENCFHRYLRLGATGFLLL